jgi:hypothetical protein
MPRFLFRFLLFLCPVLMAAESGAGGGAADPAKTDPKPLTQADLDAAVQQALGVERAKFAADFKAATGHDSLTLFQDAEAKRKGEEGKLLEQRTAELNQTRAELAQANIASAILGAAGEAIDPNTVLALLSGKAKFENGAVTIDGKPPAEAVKALLAEKPFLAKPAGGAGSGAPQNGGGRVEDNPWHPDHLNLTRQGEIYRADPAQAQRLKTEADAAKKAKKT